VIFVSFVVKLAAKASSTMKSKILCIGDIHLGRRSGKLPPEIRDYEIDPADLTPTATWRSACRWAVEHNVDAVLLAGDVVENAQDRFEAYGHLKWGVEELLAADIPVFAVAGNHDYDALPRLADQIPDFNLIGRDSKWEIIETELKNGARIRIAGWSFQDQYYRENPLSNLEIERDWEIPTLGLLHCDLDTPGSLYCPVPGRDLDAIPVDAWFLGHIHKPSPLAGPRPIGYLGSVAGLDPGEPGQHGPWLATVDGPGNISVKHLPMARLRWEREEVAIDSLTGDNHDDLKDDLLSLVSRAIDRIHQRITGGLYTPRSVGCRISLTGRSSFHRLLNSLAGEIAHHQESRGGIYYFVEKVIDLAGPAFDLAEISRGTDPPSVLARLIIDLIDQTGRVDELIAGARDVFSGITAEPQWSLLKIDHTADDETIRRIMIDSGLKALEELLAQQEERK
jgi:DNA repair protein SbcD/Mre11